MKIIVGSEELKQKIINHIHQLKRHYQIKIHLL